MSDNIKPYYMHEAGNIPGIPGMFGGGQTVYVDLDTRKVVSQMPILPPAIEATPEPNIEPEPISPIATFTVMGTEEHSEDASHDANGV